MPVNGRILCQKAEYLAQQAGHHDFQAIEGRFSRWKKRHNLVFSQLKGRSGDADVDAAKNFRKTELQDILKAYDKDILNADEAGVYFRAMPDHLHPQRTIEKKTKGFKIAKFRLTLLVCCNMAGERESILLIGKSKNPRCFKHVKKLPLDYNSSSNAWMIGYIWEKWLRQLDQKLVKEIRKVLLLIDNYLAHTEVHGFQAFTAELLPANSTSVLQSCDMGIIRTLKDHFHL